MSSEHPNHDPTSSSPEGVDDLIRRALSFEPDPQRVARLEFFWQQRRSQARWRRRATIVGGLAAAATVAFALLSVFHSKPARDLPPQARSEERPDAPDDRDDANADVLVATDAPERGEAISGAGRLPTPYERLVFVARTGGNVPAANVAATVDDLIAHVASSPNVEVGALVAEADIQRQRMEALLLRRLRRADPSQAPAIVRLLGECGSARAIPALARWARQSSQYRGAAEAIESIVGDAGLAEVTLTCDEGQLRRALFHRLMAAEADEPLRNYLSLVARRATRDEALAVVDELPTPGTEKLLALLDDQSKTMRLGAALVLGKANGTEITRSLIARVTVQPASSTEAWIALLACRGELAEDFFAYATQRPQLLGYVNGARLQWAQLVH